MNTFVKGQTTKLRGWFRSPQNSPEPVPVEAEILEGEGGRIEGVMTEPDTTYHLYGRRQLIALDSRLYGHRVGDKLQLTKEYQNIDRTSPIYYEGDYSTDGRLIDGTWKVGLKMDGEFMFVAAEGPFHLEVVEPA